GRRKGKGREVAWSSLRRRGLRGSRSRTGTGKRPPRFPVLLREGNRSWPGDGGAEIPRGRRKGRRRAAAGEGAGEIPPSRRGRGRARARGSPRRRGRLPPLRGADRRRLFPKAIPGCLRGSPPPIERRSAGRARRRPRPGGNRPREPRPGGSSTPPAARYGRARRRRGGEG